MGYHSRLDSIVNCFCFCSFRLIHCYLLLLLPSAPLCYFSAHDCVSARGCKRKTNLVSQSIGPTNSQIKYCFSSQFSWCCCCHQLPSIFFSTCIVFRPGAAPTRYCPTVSAPRSSRESSICFDFTFVRG